MLQMLKKCALESVQSRCGELSPRAPCAASAGQRRQRAVRHRPQRVSRRARRPRGVGGRRRGRRPWLQRGE